MDIPNSINKISGWLILFAIILIINLLVSIFEVVSWDSIYNNWRYSSSPIEFLFLYYLLKLVICIILTILFFKKYKAAVTTAIIFLTLIAIWPFIEFPLFDNFNSNSPLQAIISIPWLLYFILSKKVKYTFIKKR